jgi:low density lipoprotein receptor-related protein 5/6
MPITLRNTPTSTSSTLLIFTTYHDIRLANLSRNHVTSITTITKDLVEGAGLDFFYDKQLICWTDQGMEAIQCRKMNASFYHEPPIGPVGIDDLTESIEKISIITKGIEKPDGLAIDWVTDKIYWVDGELNRIEVTTINGKYQKLLFWTDLDQPRAIALVPANQLMIWSDWGENPRIERASMDGDKSSRMVLVNERIFWPNGLTVDIENNLIYWVDGRLQFLDVMNLDGSGRRTILKDLTYPYSITYINKMLYWSDWNVGKINSYDLITGEQREVIDDSEVPITVHAWEQNLQPTITNPCRMNNGNCSHLCLLSTNFKKFSCACPTGVKLLSETQCADGPQNVVFLVQRTQISRISLDSPDYTSFPLALGRVRSAISIDYDPVEDFIYWSDEDQHVIKKSRQDGTSITDVVNTEIKQPDGIAIDWIARNIHWTDAGSDRIEVCRLNGQFRRVLINGNLEEPRGIAVAPTLGWMFFSDWGKKPKIERASLDGTERVVLISDDLGWPNGITLDVEEKKIYWCDAKLDKIEVTSMDGSDRRIILNENLPHVFDLSLFDNYIYWTDWQRRTVERAHKITGSDRITVVDQFPDLMGLKVTKLHEVTGTNPCMNKNGGCAHLCLNRPHDYVCRCQIDYELAKDRKSCNLPTAFLLFAKGESIGRLSIEYNDEQNDHIIPFKDIRDATHFDVDVVDRRIYWVDQKQKSISRAYLNGSDVQKIVDLGLVLPEAVGVDWIGRNIFWADSDAKRIEVARMDGTTRRILIWKDVEEPKNLIVEPRKGYLYWSQRPSDTIKRAAMDGTDIQTIVHDANHPTSLTMDFDARRIYWATQLEPTGIESADWDGKRRIKLKLAGGDAEISFMPRALTLHQDYIYWADWNSGDIERANKITGNDRSLMYKNLGDVSTLLVFHNNRQLGSNPCRQNNGGCSHLCLALPGHRKKVCYCYFSVMKRKKKHLINNLLSFISTLVHVQLITRWQMMKSAVFPREVI